MFTSSTTIVSESSEDGFTPTLIDFMVMAEGVLYPSGFPTNSWLNWPLPDSGERFAPPSRTSTLVNIGPAVSTPFLTMVLSEKNTTINAITSSATSPTAIRKTHFIMTSVHFHYQRHKPASQPGAHHTHTRSLADFRNQIKPKARNRRSAFKHFSLIPDPRSSLSQMKNVLRSLKSFPFILSEPPRIQPLRPKSRLVRASLDPTACAAGRGISRAAG